MRHFSIAMVRYLSTGSVAMANTTKSIIHLVDMPVRANRLFQNRLQKISPAMVPSKIPTRILFMGALIL